MRGTATLTVLLAPAALGGMALGANGMLPLPLTPGDFLVPGTQVGDVDPTRLRSAAECNGCHGGFEPSSDPWSTWAGSLMALGGRDPLFFAQMTLANQDVDNVGSYCIRCHAPNAVTTGHVAPADGSTLDAADREGVACYFCHTMVDPVFKPGISPADDEAILVALEQTPAFAANAMFVLDPEDRRRGPRPDPHAYHATRYSPYHRSSALCGTCHDVGNVATTRQPDGSYRYNAVDEPAPDADPWTQFPLERTYTEWKLSAFGQGGVDMGGRFGGVRGPVVSSCQDCHMPATSGRAASFGPVRADLARHDFAGAAAPSLDLIAAHTANDPAVDQAAIATGRQRAIDMLQRAASVELRMDGELLVARVTNHAGHKLPTGHIEGRRVWLNVRYVDAAGALLREHGGYDADGAELDAATTTVYEMLVGLSDDAAAATGLTAGPSNHMALADTIVKDSRIPPQGFDNATFEAGGAPAVGIAYADGQYWHEQQLSPPPGTARVEATLYYQSLPRAYIEHLRDGNVTDHWGDTLHALWVQTGRGAPIAMAGASLDTRIDVFADGFETLP